MIKSILIVALGSSLGGALRYIISELMKAYLGHGFPWGTLAVNLLGCLAFGVVFALFYKYDLISNPWYLLLTTGVCGGFTTFSAFAHESMQMLQGGNVGAFASYVAISVVVGMLLMAFGYWVVK